MARLKMSALIEEIRGPIGTLVFGNWKGLHYVRYKAVSIANPKSDRQGAMRQEIATSVIEWWKLTDIQRALWEEFAQGLGKARAAEKRTGTKGLIVPRGTLQSGFNAYVGANQVVKSINNVRIDVPSTMPSPPGLVITCLYESGTVDLPTITVMVKPLAPVSVGTWGRLWVQLHKAGSHAYIGALSEPWDAGAEDEKSIVLSTIRQGSVGGIEEVPLAKDMRLKLQLDLADSIAKTGPASQVRVVTIGAICGVLFDNCALCTTEECCANAGCTWVDDHCENGAP